MPDIKLRALELEDLTLLYKWENDRSIWADSSTFAPYSLNQLTDYITNYDGDIYKARQLRLMIDDADTGITVGSIDIYDFDPVNARAYIGFLIDPEYRNLGYAKTAVTEVADYCRNRFSLNQLAAIASVKNVGSRQVLLSCGFQVSGLLKNWIKTNAGEYADAEIFQLDLMA